MTATVDLRAKRFRLQKWQCARVEEGSKEHEGNSHFHHLSVLSLPSGLDDSHLHLWRWSSLCPEVQMPVSLTNTFTGNPEIMTSQLSGHPLAQSNWYIKLTSTVGMRNCRENHSKFFKLFKCSLIYGVIHLFVQLSKLIWNTKKRNLINKDRTILKHCFQLHIILLLLAPFTLHPKYNYGSWHQCVQFSPVCWFYRSSGVMLHPVLF